MAEPKFPHVHVPLVGLDGSTSAIMGRVTSALNARMISISKDDEEWKELRDARDAIRLSIFDLDYNGFLKLVMETVNVGYAEDYE